MSDESRKTKKAVNFLKRARARLYFVAVLYSLSILFFFLFWSPWFPICVLILLNSYLINIGVTKEKLSSWVELLG